MAVAIAQPRATRRAPEARTAGASGSPFSGFAHGLSSARHEVTLLRSRGTLRPEEIREEAKVITWLLQRWVRIHVIWEQEVLNDPAMATYVRWQNRTQAQVRTAPDVPVTVALVDFGTALVIPEPGQISVSRCPDTTNMLRYLFHGLWDDSEPIADEDRPAADGQQRDILRMLAQGLTDQQIARQLDVSARTVGRTVSKIMTELDARSRFEAGVRAARLGWLGTTGQHR
ncbi:MULTISPECIES: helix-turn-helix transcriptional regulator [Streptomyces]|uniref:helix-turn-helix transcriptional regulator n=1 Tax=Streptomyces TaxID=1883 RepID=UPI00292D3138|nr:LuxR C-terminal-related transcriptional regulator [Streptomyces sp. NEAU-HV9]